jgi:cytidylate kinase
MAVVTISSSFGSGGSVVASLVADTLGWNMYNRAIPAEVASRLSIPVEAALTHDEAAESRLGRLLERFAVQLGSDGVGNIPTEALMGGDSFKDQSESIIRRLAESSNCVIVGRAAAIVLGNVNTALHVRLDGNKERRAMQAAEALHIPKAESTNRLTETDRARGLYVRHFYSRDWTDSRLYHLMIDSTVFSLDTCVEMVLMAVEARFGVIGAAKRQRSEPT